MLKYRADIDGLRAVAVLLVVLNHAHVSLFSGGYIGVDIFFVISGYLITSILISQPDGGLRSIIAFYDRRIRRIFPALFVMMAFVAIVGYVLFMPFDLRRIGMQTIATTGFASNLYLWMQHGYFDAGTKLLPLMHTWSLAVEEQFYIFFPILLLAFLAYCRSQLFSILVILTAVSFVLSLLQFEHDPRGAFYLPFGRAWELLLGCLIAVRPPKRVTVEQALACGVLGCLLIAVAALTFNDRSPFPGWRAALPCVGAALIIIAGFRPDQLVTRALSHRLAVGVGLISYSLYLWHWPLLVFARYAAMREMTGVETAVVVMLAFVAAYASYRFVETPFRRAGALLSRTALFGIAGGVMASSILVGVAFYRFDGLPGRLAPAARTLAMGAFDTTLGRSICDRKSAEQVLAGDLCMIGDLDESQPTFAVFADSIGISMLPGIDEAGRKAGRKGAVLTKGGCYPVVGMRQLVGRDLDEILEHCRAHADASVAYIKATRSIKTVIIVSRWTSAAEATTFGDEGGVDWFTADASTTKIGVDENKRVLRRGIERTIYALPGAEIVFVVGVPEQRTNVPRAAAFNAQFRRSIALDLDRTVYDQRQASVREAFADAAQRDGVHVFSAADVLCTGAVCPATADGQALYSDDNHLTAFGARMLAPRLTTVLRGKRDVGAIGP